MTRIMVILLLISTVAVTAATSPLTLSQVLEPNVPSSLTDAQKIAASQAISLKRIADSLDRMASSKPLECSPTIQCGPFPPK